MHDPMLSRYGNHFERKAIAEWLEEGNTFCPVTGNPLRLSNLISDKTLQWKINYWAKKQGIDFEREMDERVHEPKGLVAVPHKNFVCPLTKEIMVDPMCTREGLNFERSAILKWLDKKGDVCPVTGKNLQVSGLISNSKLKWEIGQWQLNYGDSSEEMSKLELHDKLKKVELMSTGRMLPNILRSLAIGNPEDVESSQGTVENVLSVLDDAVASLEI